MVVDGRHTWVGSSNWDGDYFLKSRNVGVVVDDSGFAGQVERLLEDAWASRYAQPLAPMGPDEKPEQRKPEPAPKPADAPEG
jgi:phosphatidylserine/phosphatidylglycerophosphate/cardiolipin synthase-like enzyme